MKTVKINDDTGQYETILEDCIIRKITAYKTQFDNQYEVVTEFFDRKDEIVLFWFQKLNEQELRKYAAKMECNHIVYDHI